MNLDNLAIDTDLADPLEPGAQSASCPDEIVRSWQAALANAKTFDSPYQHFFITDLFPSQTASALAAIDADAPILNGVSGKRELHNDERFYFDEAAQQNHAVASSVANAMQSAPMVRLLEKFFNVDLTGSYLRLEYAQDRDGFWLQPHTDLGVKKISMLIYLNDAPEGNNWGTDIYDCDKQHAKRMSHQANSALAFTPGQQTYHGYEKRAITGLRKSLILNYVTSEWRERAQLSFPNAPINT